MHYHKSKFLRFANAAFEFLLLILTFIFAGWLRSYTPMGSQFFMWDIWTFLPISALYALVIVGCNAVLGSYRTLHLRNSIKQLFLIALTSLMGLALLARWLVRDMRQAAFWWKQRLEEAYPKGIFAIWGEKILSRCLRWALALLAMGLLALWVAGCRFQVPSQLTPPDYILNLSFYRNLNLTQVSDSAYEQLCRRVLPACYGLTAAETALGLALAILQAGKGRERGGKEWPM